MGNYDEKSYRQVEDPHQGNQDACDPGDLLAAAEDGDCEDQSQDHAHKQGSHLGIKEAVSPEGVGDVEGGHQVESTHVGADQGDCEQNADPVLLKRRLDIVGRAAVGAAVLCPVFVDLGQGALDESRGASKDGGQPHPEYSACTAQADGSRDTGDISGSHTGGRGYHESLEG